MGRKSVKDNKNVYQICREDLGLTRQGAAELLECISAERIEKIESGKSEARPEEILIMAESYKSPQLCNYYCSHECPIGQKLVPEIKLKDLPQITLEMISTLNNLEKEKDRLVEITVDGVISEEEKKDFASIRKKLDDMAMAIDSLSLWVDNAISAGNMPKE